MNKIISLLILVLMSLLLNAQEIQFKEYYGSGNYGQPTTFPADAVAEDFGPRRSGDLKFHRGIDYNSSQDDNNGDKWDMILAPFNGTIVDGENRLCTSKYKYKQLCYEVDGENYRLIFGHVYDEKSETYLGKSGNTVTLKYMDSPDNDRWAEILNINGLTYVYGQVEGTVTYNNVTYTTTNKITAGHPIVPLGESSAKDAAHLHLNTIPTSYDYSTGTGIDTYGSNPLAYINYDKANYIIDIHSKDNPFNTFEVQYPGNKISPIASKIEMITTVSGKNNKRYDHIFDVNRVYWQIKNIYSDDGFDQIKGPNTMAFIQLGGKLGYEVKNHPNPNFGNWQTTGVDSRAYSATYPKQPYDIYHYSDFVTRIHKDDPMDGSKKIANCPENARYNDGEYQLQVIVEDIRSNYFIGPTTATGGSCNFIDFTLDNFKPYVQEVRIKTSYNNQDIYHEDWSCFDNEYIKFSKNDIETEVNSVDFSDGMKVYVEKTSEPLQDLKMSVPAYGISNRSPISIGSNKDYFVFEIEQTEIVIGVDVIFHFSGKDYNGNDLIAFDESHRDRNIYVPTRKSKTEWKDDNSPQLTYGVDKIHRLLFACFDGQPSRDESNEYAMRSSPTGETIIYVNGGELELSATTTNTFTPQCNNGTVDLTVNGGVPPYEYEWSNGATTEDLNGVFSGEYCVTVTDAMCGEAQDCFKVLSDNSEVIVTDVINNSECGPRDDLNSCDGLIDIEVEGSDGPYTYQWENIEDSSWSSTEEDPQDLCPGVYRVTVTHSSGCTIESDPIRICCCDFLVDDDDNSDVSCYNNENETNQNDFSLSADVHAVASSTSNDGWIDLTVTWVQSGSHPSVVYSWTGPNGFKKYTEDIYNLGVGEYCVTVTDGCNTHSDCYVIEDCSSIQFVIQGNVTNTCSGYSYGSISISVSGGSAPYTYSWSNGGASSTINNLAVGQYCVTVTDKSGCQSTKCFTVSGNVDEVETPSTNPCGWQYSCNGHNTHFTTYDGLLDCVYDPFECTRVNCYCPVTDGYVGSYYVDYLQYKLDWYYCALMGLCPNGYSWEVVQYGNRITGYYYLQICPNCYQCYYIDVCIIGDYYYVYAFYPAGDSNCGGKGPGEGLISSSIRLNELEYILRSDSILDDIDSTSTMLIAEGLSDTLFMEDYTALLEDIMQQSDTISVYPFEKSKRLTELDCSTKNCGDKAVESMHISSNNNNANIKYNISILPSPFSNELSININNLDVINSNITVEISSIIGQTLIVDKIYSNNHTIETSKLPEGVYICTIKKGGEIIKIQKIVKQ